MMNKDNSTYGTSVSAVVETSGGGNASFQCRQRYVTSSPPFDMGDGEAAGFVFLLVDKQGNIHNGYSADVPPWGYNGPTNIKACAKCKKTGKKFRMKPRNQTLEQILDGETWEPQIEEITMKMKNEDMKVIPHPFGNYDSKELTPIMIDPMDERIKFLMDAQNDGDIDILEQIIDGNLIFDQDKIKRKGPKGVGVHKLKVR